MILKTTFKILHTEIATRLLRGLDAPCLECEKLRKAYTPLTSQDSWGLVIHGKETIKCYDCKTYQNKTPFVRYMRASEPLQDSWDQDIWDEFIVAGVP